MFRRDVKLFARCLGAAALMLLLFAVVGIAAGAVYAGGGSEIYTPLKIAIVDNEDSAFSRILVHAVRGTDFLDGLIETEKMNEDEAIDALRDGTVSAAVILPEGFVDDVIHGEVSEGKVIVSGSLASQKMIVQSLAHVGETLLASGQNGVFSGGELLEEHGVGWDIRSPYYDRVNTHLLREALTAGEKYFTVEELDFCDTGVSEEAYYLILWVVMLLLLLAIVFIPLYRTDCKTPLLRRLRSLGVGDVKFTAPKLTLTFAFHAALLAAVFGAAVHFGLAEVSAASVLCLILTAAYTSLIGACASTALGNGIASSFILAAGGLIMCGGIVPRRIMPGIVTFLGDISPFGAAKALLSMSFGAPPYPLPLIAAAVYGAVSVMLIGMKLRRVRLGEAVYES